MAKLDAAREANVETKVQDAGGEHDMRAYRIFRDAHLTFLDECSRIWHVHCHNIAELSSLGQERLSKIATPLTADAIAPIQSELTKAHQDRAESLRGELERAFQAYARANASGWQAAGEQKNAEWLMWHVGTGQMNASAAYSNLLRALGL